MDLQQCIVGVQIRRQLEGQQRVFYLALAKWPVEAQSFAVQQQILLSALILLSVRIITAVKIQCDLIQ